MNRRADFASLVAGQECTMHFGSASYMTEGKNPISATKIAHRWSNKNSAIPSPEGTAELLRHCPGNNVFINPGYFLNG